MDEALLSRTLVSGRERRSILMGQISLYGTAFTLLHFFIDFAQEMYQSAIFDLIISLSIFICYILNRLHYHRVAKFSGLVVLNVVLLIYASVVPKEIGVYLFYFPLMVVSFALFGEDEKQFRYPFIFLPFVLLILLFMTDFNILGDFKFDSPPGTKMFFLINIISSGFIMILSVSFMQKLNEAAERDLQLLAEEINLKNDELERTNKELDRFLYSTSHDLQSPLASIKGLINVARYDTKEAATHAYFDKMTDRVNSLENLIKDIIDYSKNDRTHVAIEPTDFNCLVDEVTENLKYFNGAESIHFKKEIHLHGPVNVDKTRINVVLSNLMANAIKYHDFSKPNQWIAVEVTNSNRSLKIRVSDNGTGIQEEHQSRIFDMFYRGTVRSNGSGLGLYIVKQAVEKMNGEISVYSKPAEGSSFLVSLPLS
ncbi:MAG TPA: HAMP domain-containing sensor histidine kinase [Chryseosolibacter sp.]